MNRRRGFTLVELLVVIGIIAILIALLITSLRKAQMSAQRVACQSNLRQLGIGFLTYAGDHRGYWPMPALAYTKPLTDSHPEDWIHWQAGRDVTKSSILPYTGRNLNVLKCPVGTDRPLGGGFTFSYAVNCRFTGSPHARDPRLGLHFGGAYPVRLTQVRRASQKVLLIEQDSTQIGDGGWSAGSLELEGGNGWISVRHDRGKELTGAGDKDKGRGNVCFADGHVDFIRRAGPSAAHPAWCDPRSEESPHVPFE